MILENSLKNIIAKNANVDPLYLRNLFKEELQNYILDFIYGRGNYLSLIFTGGTCLRKVYGLNRLSEDLDFDFVDNFDIQAFSKEIKGYFSSTLEYGNVEQKVSANNKSVFIKFPILKEIKYPASGTPPDLFVRCDFSKDSVGNYALAKSPIIAGTGSFFVNSYDLETMFANKIAAFLERSFYKGSFQKLPFKGRDVYDIFWFLSLSAKSSYNLKPNIGRLTALLGGESVESLKKRLLEKIDAVDEKFVYEDLFPLVESREYLNQFVGTAKESIKRQLLFVFP